MPYSVLPTPCSDGELAVALFQLAHQLYEGGQKAAGFGVVNRGTRMMLIAETLHRCGQEVLGVERERAAAARVLANVDSALEDYARLYDSHSVEAARYREAIHAVIKRTR